MNPLQIFGKPAMKTMPASLLRNGQIIQGKVMKLFPNQRAEIQIAGQKVIAKLDASLTLHRSYHFQVQIKGGIIYLHVLAEQQKKTNDLLHLLHSLRLKSTKTNVAFMKLLLERLIPFDRGQLVQALSLLEGASGNEKAMEVLVYMIKNRLPMSEIVFQGLLAKTNYRQTELFQSILTSVAATRGSSSYTTAGRFCRTSVKWKSRCCQRTVFGGKYPSPIPSPAGRWKDSLIF